MPSTGDRLAAGGQAHPVRPDANLGRWLVQETGRQMDLWPGSCIVHETFSERAILLR